VAEHVGQIRDCHDADKAQERHTSQFSSPLRLLLVVAALDRASYFPIVKLTRRRWFFRAD
jgi:hypothetical protein